MVSLGKKMPLLFGTAHLTLILWTIFLVFLPKPHFKYIRTIFDVKYLCVLIFYYITPN